MIEQADESNQQNIPSCNNSSSTGNVYEPLAHVQFTGEIINTSPDLFHPNTQGSELYEDPDPNNTSPDLTHPNTQGSELYEDPDPNSTSPDLTHPNTQGSELYEDPDPNSTSPDLTHPNYQGSELYEDPDPNNTDFELGFPNNSYTDDLSHVQCEGSDLVQNDITCYTQIGDQVWSDKMSAKIPENGKCHVQEQFDVSRIHEQANVGLGIKSQGRYEYEDESLSQGSDTEGAIDSDYENSLDSHGTEESRQNLETDGSCFKPLDLPLCSSEVDMSNCPLKNDVRNISNCTGQFSNVDAELSSDVDEEGTHVNVIRNMAHEKMLVEPRSKVGILCFDNQMQIPNGCNQVSVVDGQFSDAEGQSESEISYGIPMPCHDEISDLENNIDLEIFERI